jgi:hypothetical protein
MFNITNNQDPTSRQGRVTIQPRQADGLQAPEGTSWA